MCYGISLPGSDFTLNYINFTVSYTERLLAGIKKDQLSVDASHETIHRLDNQSSLHAKNRLQVLKTYIDEAVVN